MCSFFFNETATTEIYTLSLHDALPICHRRVPRLRPRPRPGQLVLRWSRVGNRSTRDRKSTRLNSSHLGISYAVFCLKKKKRDHEDETRARDYEPAQSELRSQHEP